MIGIFRKDILPIGGIETWLYYLAKKFGPNNDITVYYEKADAKQIERIEKYARCEKYSGQEVTVDKAIFCFDMMGLDKVKANEYIHIVHADYQEIKVKFNPSRTFDRIYAVSEIACDSFTDSTGLECDVLYNPLAIDEPHPVLHLVSATRLSEEKGLWRMIDLATELDEAGYKYVWDIYTNDTVEFDNPNVRICKPRLDMSSFIAKADYLVQLSDTESYCYSIVEALSLGTPIITTKLPVLAELGITEDHGVIIPLNEYYFGKYIKDLKPGQRVNYRPLESNWAEIFGEQ